MNEVLALPGLLVTVIGFGITIWQLVRTADASTATKNAIIEANKRMLLNHVLVLVPQLKTLEIDLDSAILENDHLAANRALVAFSHAANQVASLLESDKSSEHGSLVVELREAASTATSAKAALVSGPVRSLKPGLKLACAEIAEVSSKCSGITAYYQMKAAA